MFSAYQPSPVKDGRRILGEKPANACLLSPARNNKTVLDTESKTSPVKQRTSCVNDENACSSVSPSRKPLPSPSFVGRKRSIEQVDGGGGGGGGGSVNKNGLVHGHREVTRSVGEDGDVVRTSRVMDSKKHSEQPIETRHEPQPATNVSNESDQSHGHDATRTVPEDPETRKVFIQEKANLLRTRIQSAMRHVRDHQFDRRLSELEEHSRKYPRLSRPHLPLPSQSQSQSPQTHSTTIPTTTARPISTSPTSELTPRTLQPSSDLEPRHDAATGISSPPLSTDNATEHDPMRTPTQNRAGGADSSAQLSSPPATVSRSGYDYREDTGTNEDNGCRTSQKVDAVDGLLKLMGRNTEKRDLHPHENA